MPPKFGTSGLRGLVSELTDGLCAGYVRAFLKVTPHSGHLMIGRDLRPSSERIAAAVAAAAAAEGLTPVDCGALPTPALALAAMEAGAPSVMVTGSHIPADRNGLKFYTANGEITKADEAAILRVYAGETTCPPVEAVQDPEAVPSYRRRYLSYLGRSALAGLRVGVYEHSSVARDLLSETLRFLGAETVSLGRSETFIPVDTEAVDILTRDMLAGWAAKHDLSAIVSTDGDADRPLMTDAAGRVIPGDVLGVLTASLIGADTVVTPVSSNTMIELSGRFTRVIRTKIGSPYVIAAMQAAPKSARVAGFEANGGFLLGFAAEGRGGLIAPLATRDAFLPILLPLVECVQRRVGLGDLVAALPARATASDRLTEVETEKSLALVELLSTEPEARQVFFDGNGPETALDQTDGLRVTFQSGNILHLRPSGNAPELRCYAEAEDTETATELVQKTLEVAREAIG